MRASSSRAFAVSSDGSCATFLMYRSKTSRRSSHVGVRKKMWRPMRPGRMSAGSSDSSGTLQAPMK